MKKLQRQKIMVDAVVTDPPYHLQSIVERFGKDDVLHQHSLDTDGAFKEHQLVLWEKNGMVVILHLTQ